MHLAVLADDLQRSTFYLPRGNIRPLNKSKRREAEQNNA
jgi:hypothetical protein